jgi:hypothetical protein
MQRHGSNHVHAADVRADVNKRRKQALVEIATSPPVTVVKMDNPDDVRAEMAWAYGEKKLLYEMAKTATDLRRMETSLAAIGASHDQYNKSMGVYNDGLTVNIDVRQQKLIELYDSLPSDILVDLKQGRRKIESIVDELKPIAVK